MTGAPDAATGVRRVAISARLDDPRAATILRAARDLGIDGLRAVRVVDLVFVRGRLDDRARHALSELLVEPLTQTGEWDSPTEVARYVETALLPGVTDAASEQLLRVAARLGLEVSGVATGRRVEIEGAIDDARLAELVVAQLANPIIERWSVDRAIEPVFVDSAATPRDDVERVALDAHTPVAELLRLNDERGLALDEAELVAVRDHFAGLGRHPSDVELETIAQTWSEHCAHKTFRARIVADGEALPDSLLGSLRRSTESIGAPFVVSAFVGNAGVVSFSPGRTFALKCETHNHPSAIEPFGGANTGVGGVIRDVLGAAHRPIACTDILCFGPLDADPRGLPAGVLPPRRIHSGVIDGIADYGNKIGLPTVAGAVLYDPGYLANPLVFAGCVGAADDWREPEIPRPGDRCLLLGGRTGRDGIRGATFSSMTMDATTGDVSGASVQIGDPITEKLLIDVLADARDLYRAITDCGAGGLSSAIGEMADGVGVDVELTSVPLKYPGLAPWEVWLSEAQERMIVAVAPEHVAELRRRCNAHGVECTDLGAFTGDERLVVRHRGVPVVELDLRFLHDGRPRREMAATMPRPQRTGVESTPSWLSGADPTALLLALLAHPTIASKASIVHRYDHEIRGATLARPLVGAADDGHGDGVVLVEPTDDEGIAIGVGVNPWFGVVDPERMARAVVDEAIRNVVAVGADPDRVALLDNFSWGDPRRSSTLGELVAAVSGCTSAADAFRAPFVSGKDSLNNEYLASDGRRRSVPPTLVITAVAHVPDASTTPTADLRRPGDVLLLTGRSRHEYGGSHAAAVLGVESSGAVPDFDEAAPGRYRALHRLIRDGVVVACHDVSEGGALVAVAEMAIAGRLGAALHTAAPEVLFGESLGRHVIEVRAQDVDRVAAALDAVVPLAEVTAAPVLRLAGGEEIALDRLRAAWERTP